MNNIYLDYNATAPTLPEVSKAMQAWYDTPANASSVHQFGREAKKAIEQARANILQSISAEGYNLTFTSGGTEANNLALRGLEGRKILVAATEHLSVPEAASDAEIIPVHKNGTVDLESLSERIKAHKGNVLVSVMLANNETGIIQNVKTIADIVIPAGGYLHCDAVQAYGKIPLDITKLGADMLTLSSHKIGGPLGAGALITKPGIALKPIVRGGGQELGMRSGTQNTPAIHGFGLAASLIKDMLNSYQSNMNLRDYIETALPDAEIIGADTPRIPNTSLITMPGVKAQTQLIHFDLNKIAVSAGSACSSGKVGISHVLRAMQVPEAQAECAIRVSLGPQTTKAEIETFINTWLELHARAGKTNTQSPYNIQTKAA